MPADNQDVEAIEEAYQDQIKALFKVLLTAVITHEPDARSRLSGSRRASTWQGVPSKWRWARLLPPRGERLLARPLGRGAREPDRNDPRGRLRRHDRRVAGEPWE